MDPAPPSTNRQPWTFVIVSDPGLKRRIREAGQPKRGKPHEGQPLIRNSPNQVGLRYQRSARCAGYASGQDARGGGGICSASRRPPATSATGTWCTGSAQSAAKSA